MEKSMERNTIYVVIDSMAYVVARTKTISMLGYDDGGKFYLPLRDEMVDSNMIIQKNENDPLAFKFLTLPPIYRFKTVRREPTTMKEPNEDCTVGLSFCRWVNFNPYMYGNDSLLLWGRKKEENKTIKWVWDIEKLFDNRVYISETDKVSQYAVSLDWQVNIKNEDEEITAAIPPLYPNTLKNAFEQALKLRETTDQIDIQAIQNLAKLALIDKNELALLELKNVIQTYEKLREKENLIKLLEDRELKKYEDELEHQINPT